MESISEFTIKRYNNRLKIYGYSPKTLGWLKGKQGLRFHVLTSVGKIENSSILDLGCGFGDLYGYLKYMKYSCKYLGLELNPNLIDFGRIRYPKARFRIFDVEKNKIKDRFDWVIISGMFNFKRKKNYEYIENILKNYFKNCKKGLAVDFLSSYVNFKNKDANYVSPERILKICKKISKRVVIRHDYMPFEFCVYIYKNQKIRSDNSFIEYTNNLKKEIRSDKWLKSSNNKIYYNFFGK